jgi:hypothetical protein
MKKVILLIGLLTLGAVCFTDPVEGYRVSIEDKTERTTTARKAMVCVEINVETKISYEKNS